MFKRILVPLDGSQLAERGLAPSLALAEAYQSEVLFLRVPDPAITSGLAPTLAARQSLERARQESAEYLAKIRQGFERFGVAPRSEVLDGEVAEVLLETATQEGVDLIVISSHGRSGVSRWVYGSVAERVLGHAPCPVLVLRSERPLARLLIPLDGSPLSEQAVAPGLAAARAWHSQSISLLRGIPAPAEGEEAPEAALREAQEYLQSVAARQAPAGLHLQYVVLPEPAADTIVEYAEQENMDLIVMATHGRTGLQRWRYGSVTEKVLHGTACSMLVVRPPTHAHD
jgi:nucleotide-binding universal stress UspA family protein